MLTALGMLMLGVRVRLVEPQRSGLVGLFSNQIVTVNSRYNSVANGSPL
jgi:hypothetical protein